MGWGGGIDSTSRVNSDSSERLTPRSQKASNTSERLGSVRLAKTKGQRSTYMYNVHVIMIENYASKRVIQKM